MSAPDISPQLRSLEELENVLDHDDGYHHNNTRSNSKEGLMHDGTSSQGGVFVQRPSGSRKMLMSAGRLIMPRLTAFQNGSTKHSRPEEVLGQATMPDTHAPIVQSVVCSHCGQSQEWLQDGSPFSCHHCEEQAYLQQQQQSLKATAPQALSREMTPLQEGYADVNVGTAQPPSPTGAWEYNDHNLRSDNDLNVSNEASARKSGGLRLSNLMMRRSSGNETTPDSIGAVEGNPTPWEYGDHPEDATPQQRPEDMTTTPETPNSARRRLPNFLRRRSSTEDDEPPQPPSLLGPQEGATAWDYGDHQHSDRNLLNNQTPLAAMMQEENQPQPPSDTTATRAGLLSSLIRRRSSVNEDDDNEEQHPPVEDHSGPVWEQQPPAQYNYSDGDNGPAQDNTEQQAPRRRNWISRLRTSRASASEGSDDMDAPPQQHDPGYEPQAAEVGVGY